MKVLWKPVLPSSQRCTHSSDCITVIGTGPSPELDSITLPVQSVKGAADLGHSFCSPAVSSTAAEFVSALLNMVKRYEGKDNSNGKWRFNFVVVLVT
jgi:hypothetical protein